MDAAETLSQKIFKYHKSHLYDYDSCSSIIAKMTGCMPLAIICISATVAEQLVSPEAGQPNVSARNRFDAALRDALIGIAKIPSMKPLFKSLALGYPHCLPLHLKTCLLQSSIYPPSGRFERDDLIRNWMDEGFVEEEQARGYFDELVKCGYISPAQESRTRVVEYEISAMVLAYLRATPTVLQKGLVSLFFGEGVWQIWGIGTSSA